MLYREKIGQNFHRQTTMSANRKMLNITIAVDDMESSS